METTHTAAPAFGADAERLENVARRLRQALGDHAFEAERRHGSDMGDDGAVALATQALRRLRRRQVA